jgi:hypothetical protein
MNFHNILVQNKFNDSMNREQIEVSNFYGGSSYRAFFRRYTDGIQKRDTLLMFYDVDSPCQQGTLVNVNGKTYIAVNRETVENGIYFKSALIRTNGEINANSGEVIGLPFYAEKVNNSMEIAGTYFSLIDGNTLAITQDCEISRKLQINDLFNVWGRTWKITNIFYIDGLVYIQMEINGDTDITFDYGISFDDVSSSYVVSDSHELNAKSTLNGEITDDQITYESSNSQVATVDSDGVISFVGSGEVYFTLSNNHVSVQTSTTQVSEQAAEEGIKLIVDKCELVYYGFDEELNYSVKNNGVIVDNIPITFTIENETWRGRTNANTKVSWTSNKVTICIDTTNAIGKTFELVGRNSEYGIEERQTITVRSMF